MNFWDAMLAIFILTCATATAFTNGDRSYAIRDARTMSAALDAATALAADGNGATLTITPTSTGSLVALYSGEPDGTQTPAEVRTFTLSGTVTANGSTLGTLFVDPSRALRPSATVWTSGTASAPSACSGTLSIKTTVQTGVVSFTVDCYMASGNLP